MDYTFVIKGLHKLLRVYETRGFDDYKSYLSSFIQELDGLNEPSRELIRLLRRLRGLRKWTELETTHHDVKDCVLDGRGKLERERDKRG